MALLSDLAVAARKSGLKVIELDKWRGNYSGGEFDVDGVLCHHTGSYDDIADAADDLSYAKWLAFIGRSDLDPPLCNLALSAEAVVYVCAAGNANHAGQAKASGPMPAASDGNALYIGIEAMNSGSQGWNSKGTDANGNEVTQYEAYVRLCAALCEHYGWPATHVRAHKETSVTGKVDPGLMDMDKFRTDIDNYLEGDMAQYDGEIKEILENTRNILKGQEQIKKQNAKLREKVAKLVTKGSATRADLQEIMALLEEELGD